MNVRFSSSDRPGKISIGIAALAASGLLLTACSPIQSGGGSDGSAGGTTTITIATGGTGGVYYPFGGGIATMIRNDVEGHDATVQETNASVDNMLLVQNGSADLAFGVGDVVSDAIEGAGSFEGNPADICSIGNLYNNFMHLVTTNGTGLGSVEEMRGKKISVGAPGSATEIGAVRILAAAGIDAATDIDRRQLGAAETVQALRDGTIDAGFWDGGLPTGAIIDLASTGEMLLVPIGEYADDLVTEYGEYYAERDVPANTYEGQTEPVSVISSPNILVASVEMDEGLQEDITAAIFDNKEALIQVQPAAEELDPATAGDVPFINTCPGSQAYYDRA